MTALRVGLMCLFWWLLSSRHGMTALHARLVCLLWWLLSSRHGMTALHARLVCLLWWGYKNGAVPCGAVPFLCRSISLV